MGGVLGGIVLLGIILIACIILILQHRRIKATAYSNSTLETLNSQYHVEPYSSAYSSTSDLGPPPRYKEVVQ